MPVGGGGFTSIPYRIRVKEKHGKKVCFSGVGAERYDRYDQSSKVCVFVRGKDI